MKSWSAPEIPSLPARGKRPTVFCSSHRGPAGTCSKKKEARLYVCGITPYDATHLGHAATYVAFDVLQRLWLDAGIDVTYVQNITDVDDPLLERAAATGADWRELATSQIDLFRSDMEHLRVIPPASYIGAVESIPEIVEAVTALVDAGATYTLENGDVYYRVRTAVEPPFGSVSHLTREEMLELFAERGGDPKTPGKEDPLDALLWRAARPGEPEWDGGRLGPGRPGWHIECAVIARAHAGLPLTVQGGGSDLAFPHHEMGAAHAEALTGEPFAGAYMHVGMVGYEGEKMSKSKGNLVLVSRLVAGGADPMAIRAVILSHHYRSDWEYVDGLLADATARLESWRAAARAGTDKDEAEELVAELRAVLADDIDTPAALDLLDDWADEADDGDSDPEGTALVIDAVDALLGIDLR
ncbi:cysteine--1-D-myo-inosityl 2-amino-2-deoxy-alpha-D-glucopyranoside ligase [Brevibacterium album]|uniref:cysteine--1-D-myo-inosityl 2-amino-2-deoxy-alpha-D-glucopyranoside ligase n=1 Tax=Brevibacterium album TaxID=417948 RepID=UPI00049039E7|nr:cysteine--1-D-myo-inosityl 2-amino-2-deoxy-alpha-D-glucopyranoside ligase [Brevibacterium album]